MYYYRARYYDSGVGRFISEDPIMFFGFDFNPYRYVNNNPVMLIDPSGKITIGEIALVTVILGILVEEGIKKGIAN